MVNTGKLKCVSFVCLFTTVSWAAATSSSIVAAGYMLPTPVWVAPGQIITFFVHGIGSGLTGAMYATRAPLPTSLAGISATLAQFNPAQPVPILAVEAIPTCSDMTQAGCGTYTAVTLQMPFELQAVGPGEIIGAPPAGARLVVSENGAVAATVDLLPAVDQIHLLRTCDVLYTRRELICHTVAAHADGMFITTDNPAKTGEEIVLYGFGLGSSNPPVPTGQAPSAPTPAASSFSISFDPRQNALAARPPVGGAPTPPLFVGLTPNYVGLYQINIKVPPLPAGSAPCTPLGASGFNGIRIESNLTIDVGGPVSFDGAGICVEP